MRLRVPASLKICEDRHIKGPLQGGGPLSQERPYGQAGAKATQLFLTWMKSGPDLIRPKNARGWSGGKACTHLESRDRCLVVVGRNCD